MNVEKVGWTAKRDLQAGEHSNRGRTTLLDMVGWVPLALEGRRSAVLP